MRACEHGQQVSAYHDGELSPESARAFEAHLSRCAVCARELAELRRLSAFLMDARVPSVPRALLVRLHRQAVPVPEKDIARMAGTLAAAAAVIFLVCCSWVWQTVGPSAGPSISVDAWEWTAVAPGPETPAGDAQQVAEWIVADLSLGNGHD